MSFDTKSRHRIAIGIFILFLAPAAYAQEEECSEYHDFATVINEPIVICDEQNTWTRFKKIRDFISVTANLENGIKAYIEVDVSVGVENRPTDYRYWESSTRTAAIDNLGADRTLQFSESLTKIDGYPAFTYVYNDRERGKDVFRADTILLLSETTIHVRTVQVGDNYTDEHAAQHAKILSNIVYDWDMYW